MSCSCGSDECEYKIGDQVKILNKSMNKGATVTWVDCDCESYQIAYYSLLDIRRHRYVKPGEIEHK